MPNKRQRKKAEKKSGDVMKRTVPPRRRTTYTGQEKWIPAMLLLNPAQIIFIDSITAVWEKMLRDFGNRDFGNGQTVEVTDYEVLRDQPGRSALPGGSDDHRRRLTAGSEVKAAGRTESVDHAAVPGRGTEKDGD